MDFIDRFKKMIAIDRMKIRFPVGTRVISAYVPGRPGIIKGFVPNEASAIVRWNGFFLHSGAAVPCREESYPLKDLILHYPPEYEDFKERIRDRIG